MADDGTILTANHVIADGGAITVTFADGTTANATVAAADPKLDIAALTPARLPQVVVPATLGGGAGVGAPVVAIGNPLGLTDSVSAGVISGLDRTADTINGTFSGLIQFDASVNPGSSGGPLLDAHGLVIGIVVSLAAPDGRGRVRRHRVRGAHRRRARRRKGAREGAPDMSDTAMSDANGNSPGRRHPMTEPPNERPSPSPGQYTNPLQPVLFEVKRTIVGQDVLLERMAIALLSGGHLLVEGVPGLAKTLSVKSLAAAIGGQFQRIQFTPDLVPADLTGTRVYHQHTGEFQTQLGPVFTNLLLADEINRAPAKVQSALLEVMQEHQVTIGRETYQVPEPFLVMATQNPIESEGTYPLPEAQVDRFMMKVVVGYPSATEEHAIIDRALRPAEPVRAMLGPADLIGMQERAREIYVDPAVVDYAVRLVTATRRTVSAGLADLQRYISYGASPRASIALVTGARALAFLHGRDYVLPDDVGELALDVLRHRIVLSYEALADDITADTIIAKVLDAVAAPEVVLSGR